MPVGDLYRTFDDIIRYFHEGTLVVRNVNDFGNKVVVVLQDKDCVDTPRVEVIDATKNPDVDIITEPILQPYCAVVDKAKKQPKGITTTASTDDDEVVVAQGRVVLSNGKTTCKYCGRSVTARGVTRHENKCDAKPLDSCYTARKVKRKK